MFRKRPDVQDVMGWRIAPPRVTLGGAFAVLKYIALPLFGALALLDVIFYLYFQHVLGRCYGVLCLLS
jgi:hypothetical protein